MNNSLVIREYKSEDKPLLLVILTLNVPEYFVESEIKDFENYLAKDIEKYFVVEINNRVIGGGGVNFENEGRTGKISWDFIDPKFHGKGIGKKLLGHRIDLLKSNKRVELIMVRTSQFAYKFYEKNGFVLKEKVKDYWAKGFDLYRMEYNQP